MKTTATNRKIRELVGQLREGKLQPRPDFQRRLVWSNKDKSFFIETVLLQYPFPEVYIAAGEVDVETGEAKEMLVDGGFYILLRNLDDPSKYSSVEFAAVLVEELTKNPKDTFDDLRFRMRYPGIPDPRFVGATNPGSIGHGWVKKLWVTPDSTEPDEEQELFHYVHAKYSDNKYIDASYVRQLKALPEKKRRAYMDGDWNVFDGQFFSDFTTNKHVCKPFTPKASLPKIGGMDWGRTAPFVFLGSAVQTVELEDGRKFHRVWTYKEVDGTEKTPEEVADAIQEAVNLDEYLWVRADPKMFHKADDGSESIADRIKKVWGKNGYKLKPANNDRIGGWAIMHNWLSIAPDGLPYWLITKDCTDTIRTIPELVHDENKVEDVDTDTEDHWGDAGRYKLVHLKFINASIGGVKDKTMIRVPSAFAQKDSGGLGIDLDAFSTTTGGGERDWRAV